MGNLLCDEIFIANVKSWSSDVLKYIPESITRFFDLRSSSFATRHSPNKFGSTLAAPSGDSKAFARELFMSDYEMGDGAHEFRTSWTTDRTMPRLLPMEQRAQSHACMNFAEIPEQARQPVAFRDRGSHQATYR